ncbi:hypothetical protein CONPUDRAFT_164268 [Coniophora puteana RWD-64-598 SS2]|uniref:Uncharacterized protein n=1 Tax=Coniophora puteana (strain RWD-64-598) TaxID=741705 RepID=A0A5M3MW13_CONPW|nr:uncharacterized protein CONPUDRAFT_164268 [Coniophora puteana RWD-64-598 SS2]EIW83306.1 hypothetical protein CONPUDRAFT_164268 [Coniophora puteana RWD-64-598 SS2]
MVSTGLHPDAHQLQPPNHRGRFMRVRLRDANGTAPSGPSQLASSPSYASLSTDTSNSSPGPQPLSATSPPSSTLPHPADSSSSPSPPVPSGYQPDDPNQIGASAIVIVVLAAVLLAAVVGSQLYRRKGNGATAASLRCCLARPKPFPPHAPPADSDSKELKAPNSKTLSPTTTAVPSSASITSSPLSAAPNTPTPTPPAARDIFHHQSASTRRSDSAASLLRKKAASLLPGSRFTEVEDSVSHTITLRALQAANPSSWTTASSCLSEAQYLNFHDGDDDFCVVGFGTAAAAAAGVGVDVDIATTAGSPRPHERTGSQTASEIAVRLGQAFHATTSASLSSSSTTASGSLEGDIQPEPHSSLSRPSHEGSRRGSFLSMCTQELDDRGMDRAEAGDTPWTLPALDRTYFGTEREEADGSFVSTLEGEPPTPRTLVGHPTPRYHHHRLSTAENSPRTLGYDSPSARTFVQPTSPSPSGGGGGSGSGMSPSKSISHISFGMDSWDGGHSAENENDDCASTRDAVVLYEFKRAQTRSVQLQAERAHLVSVGSPDRTQATDGDSSVGLLSVSPPSGAREPSSDLLDALETGGGGGVSVFRECMSSGTLTSSFSLGDFPLPPTRIPTM